MNIFTAILLSVTFAAAPACKGKGSENSSATGKDLDNPSAKGTQATGNSGETIRIDGSSTVFPVSEAVAEEFRNVNSAKVTVAASGTGGGFKKFCDNQTTLSGASRPIRESEAQKCESNGIKFIELPVAYDGIAVVVNKSNDWVDYLTVAELKKIWEPAAQGKITKWSHVREGWPEKDIKLYGPGTDSGTYDYFTKATVGKEHASRGDFLPNEDDNILVQGVAGDAGSLGYFGYAYYAENEDKLKLVPIKYGDKEPVAPSIEAVANGTYQPLSRPIFIYVAISELQRPEVKAFVDFYLKEAANLTEDVGYIPLPEELYSAAKARLAAQKTGSMFGAHGSVVGADLKQLLAK